METEQTVGNINIMEMEKGRKDEEILKKRKKDIEKLN